MADSASEFDVESDTSSVEGVKDNLATNEQLSRRVESLQQENRVLKTEIETLKLKIRGLNEANQQLRRNSVNIQAKAEQEEEYISNTLLKKITELKKEKESLALNYEQEEECLTNELNRKFTQLRQEKVALERTLAREQEDQVTKLKLRIEKLETDMSNKQECLDRLRREKIELENALEQEQEALVNRLWKKMEKLETEKRTLQEKLESMGALLSASSSTQSLPAAAQSTAATSDSVCNSADPSQSVAGAPGNRPASSGPGSFRGSLRTHDHVQALLSGASSHPSAPPSLPTNRPPVPTALLVGPVGPTGGDCHSLHLNRRSSKTDDVLPLKANLTASVSVSNLIPPQSPMDVDAFEHAASGSVSPCCIAETTGPELFTPKNGVQSATSNILSLENSTALPSSSIASESAITRDPQLTAPYVNRLREEVSYLRRMLDRYEAESACKMPLYESEERSAIEENRRLRKLLQVEKERREALSRQLSESESSLEMEDERQFNEACRNPRFRTTSDSSSSFHPPNHPAWALVTNPSAIYGPGHAYAIAVAAGLSGQPNVGRCRECGQRVPSHPDEWSTAVSAYPSIGRGPPTTLLTGANSSTVGRMFPSTCCSSPNATGKPCGSQHNHPNSPATPTTSSGSGNGQSFVKPTNRVQPVSSWPERASVGSDLNGREKYFEKQLSSYMSHERLFVDVDPDNRNGEPD
ncbi:unnamed protein product, partial [Dicrocoelium dendriticum]